MSYKIAIDGPAGAGKSTLAKKIAGELGYVYIDTGAMYRTVALYLIRNDVDFNNEEEIKKVIDNINVDIEYKDGGQQLFLNGENVTNLIRTNEVSNAASVSSQFPTVRNKLTELQRKIAEKTSVVMDGRDIGTVVLPNANLKIFLTASVEERAKRRHSEYQEKGVNVSLEDVKKEIEERDKRDSQREVAPLKQAHDAILVDNSNMNKDEVCDFILKKILG